MLNVGLIVDCQRDFLDPNGALYVKHLDNLQDKGSVKVVPRIVEAAAWFRSLDMPMIFTGDWHGYDDAEIDTINPDYFSTFPPHCMGRTDSPDGAELIQEFMDKDMVVLSLADSFKTRQAHLVSAVNSGKPVFVQKNRFDVFSGHPQFEQLLKTLLSTTEEDGLHLHVIGVASDVCVHHAIRGCVLRGHTVTVYEDAIYGLDPEAVLDCKAVWKERGVTLTTLHG